MLSRAATRLTAVSAEMQLLNKQIQALLLFDSTQRTLSEQDVA